MEHIVHRVVEGRTVYYTPRAGGDLVMLTRLAGAGGGVWDGVWPHLAARHAVASVELGSPEPDLAPHAVFERYAQTIIAAAVALGHRRVHVVGWNGGAHIALAAGAMAPPELASLTLLTPFRETAERRQIDVGLDLLELILRSGNTALYARHWFMAGFSDRFIEERFDDVEALAQKRLANDGFLAIDVDRAMAWMRALRRDHMDDAALSAIACPVLVIAAGQNRWHAGPTQAMAEAIHRLIAHSELAVFEGLGGFFPIEVPERTASTILAFIERQVERRPTQDYQ